MKKILFILSLCCSFCFANLNTIETSQQAYDRQSARNYYRYEQNNHQAPLGGYNQPLGGSAGTQYGMTNRDSFSPSSSYNSSHSLNTRNSGNSFNNW